MAEFINSLTPVVFHLQYQLDTVIYWTACHQVVITSTLEMGTGSVSESLKHFSTWMKTSAQEDCD